MKVGWKRLVEFLLGCFVLLLRRLGMILFLLQAFLVLLEGVT